MIGAIAGDIVGSVYEGRPIKTKDFPLFQSGSDFTDDTVLSVAVADVLLGNGSYAELYKRYFQRYPNRGFGASFYHWARSVQNTPYNSFGNGSAMRISPVGWARDSLEEVLEEAHRSASVTHNHPEGIKGAQATAAAVFLARSGEGRQEIKKYIEATFGYDLHRSLETIRPDYHFDVTCQGSVPESILCFLVSDDYEDAIRNAVSLGGDSDTMACIAGGIAEAFYGGVPESIRTETWRRLDPALRKTARAFIERFGLPDGDKAE